MGDTCRLRSDDVVPFVDPSQQEDTAEVDRAENSGKIPTILMILGWRFFFYVNEWNESIHVHCRKGDAEGKYCLDIQGFETIQAHVYNMSPADKRTVRRIIFEHFDYIVTEWNKFQERKNG